MDWNEGLAIFKGGGKKRKAWEMGRACTERDQEKAGRPGHGRDKGPNQSEGAPEHWEGLVGGEGQFEWWGTAGQLENIKDKRVSIWWFLPKASLM